MSDESFILLSRLLGIAAGVIVLMAITIPWIIQRIKKRRRCPRCWYDLSHSPGLQCSECGHTAKRERRLYRPKRAHRAVAFALLLAVGGYAAMVTPAVKDRGWPAAVPTTALVIAYPYLRPDVELWLTPPPSRRPVPNLGTTPVLGRVFAPDPLPWRDALFDELVEHRAPHIDASSGHGQLIAMICRQKRPGHFTASRPYKSQRDMLIGCAHWADDTEIDWQGHRLDLPYTVTLHTRDRWPVGYPIYAAPDNEIRQPARLTAIKGSQPTRRFLATPTAPGGHPWEWTQFSKRTSARMIPIGEADATMIGPLELTFDLETQARMRSSRYLYVDRWQTTNHDAASVSTEIVPTLGDVLTAVDDDTLTTQLHHSATARFRYRPGVGRRTRFPLFTQITMNHPHSAGTFIGSGHLVLAYRSDVLVDGRIIATADHLATTRLLKSIDGRSGAAATAVDQETLNTLADGDVITIRITGDPSIALRDFDATHYWAGTFEIPCTVTIR